MPRQIRNIKYHPAADLTKPSIILKSTYINILQNMKKTIQKSNLTSSRQELTQTSHSCQIKLKNTLKSLRKEPALMKTEKPLVQALTRLFRACATAPEFPLYSFIKSIDIQLENVRRMRQPSPKFFKLIQSLNDLLETQDQLYQKSMVTRKLCHDLQKILNSLKIHTPITDSLNELLPSLKIYDHEIAKFAKPTKQATQLRAILKNANKLKYISGKYEKGQI